MNNKPSPTIQPLLSLNQPGLRPTTTALSLTSIPRQHNKFNIKRFDLIHTDSVIDTLIHSLENVRRTTENTLEVLTTDYKHGLYCATSSTANIILNPPTDESNSNCDKPPQVPSLLSIKTNQPKTHSIFPVFNNDSNK
jgi:hypothetical protein